jgi:hypothetical protein
MLRSIGIIKQGDSYHFYPEAQSAGGYWIQMTSHANYQILLLR